MNKSTRILISVSLFCNVLLIGLVAGHLISHKHVETFGAHSHEHSCGRESFDKIHAKRFEFRKQIKQAREAVYEALVAEEFDAVLYQSRADDLHKAYRQVAQSMTQTIKDKATGLSQQERLEMAEDLRRFREHRRGKH